MPIRRSPNEAGHTRPQPGRDRSEQVVAINRNAWSQSAGARNYQKNFIECVKELGLNPDVGFAQKIQSEGGRVLRRWYFQSEAQQATFNDCVSRKASLAPSLLPGAKFDEVAPVPESTGKQKSARSNELGLTPAAVFVSFL
jgi:hypothetical protein